MLKEALPRQLGAPNPVSLLCIALTTLLPCLTSAFPMGLRLAASADDKFSITHHSPLTETQYWTYMITSFALVLMGGVFSGLTLGLMGQDEVHLKVISQSGSLKERQYADTVLNLLAKGKHWLLVTLLLANVLTNETLPVILDRFLGGGFAAVFGSTVLIVVFGEIIPQSICVRYGLQIGAFFSPFVEILMYIMYPVAFPIAKLLDYSLGQDHGILYGKSGLKTLVNLHHTMGVERLSQDEVTIINAVLDLKDKAVGEVMTPIEKVFTLPSDTILDESIVEEIFNAGFSRIPIHLPGEPTNFVGMLLVRILISYDPDDGLPVSSFPLATLPETGYYTSCLNILNYFQEGKSHMVVVSESPGMDTGAKGVVTLEDVIEELIGEEIVDESDVYVDVDRNIKRSIPGPLAKRNIVHYLHNLYNSGHEHSHEEPSDVFTSPLSPIEGRDSQTSSSYILKKDFEEEVATKKAQSVAEEMAPLLGLHDTHGIANVTQKLVEGPQNSAESKVASPDLSRAPLLLPLSRVEPITITKGIKPSNLAANPLHTNNEHITIKKQPKLVPPVTGVFQEVSSSQDGYIPTAKNKYALKADARARLASENRFNYGSAGTSPAGSPLSRPVTPPGVYDTEVSAFVKGVSDNVLRRKARPMKDGRTGTGTDTSPGARNKSAAAIELARSNESMRSPGSFASNDSNSSAGIVESSMVTDSGFRKTVIEESAGDDEALNTGEPRDVRSERSIEN
ncbi:hypothetical protein FOA43_001627 [Brettanomyces nanus]|uniref:DUF21-domain-containing protein n=1 Tax=Eeniella nana TaxID=13502 RepID=A0A875RXT4_EENNA|nr:uncharacterized protein FOA43_001627 [Brettanomyces nanus]QPG74301.1 hypothetical protein FOA43_001627 [Brettanomyces nanus]